MVELELKHIAGLNQGIIRQVCEGDIHTTLSPLQWVQCCWTRDGRTQNRLTHLSILMAHQGPKHTIWLWLKGQFTQIKPLALQLQQPLISQSISSPTDAKWMTCSSGLLLTQKWRTCTTKIVCCDTKLKTDTDWKSVPVWKYLRFWLRDFNL